MGRHSSPDQVPFYRSVASWSLPWVMFAGVIGVVVWIGVDAVSKDDAEVPPPATVAQESPTPESSPEPEETEPVGTPKPERTREPEPEEPPTVDGSGTTVQVLNGTNSSQADDRMANRLVRLDFTVVALESASRQYSETTVFWSFAGSRDIATALAERFGWVAQEKPANLSSSVDIHVVVGSDEA